MNTATHAVDWRDQAACAGQDPALWFGHDTGPAVDTCRGCPVRAECLHDALAHETDGSPRYGIRGGLTASQRKQIPPLPRSKTEALAALREVLTRYAPIERTRPAMTAAPELPAVDVQLKDSADVRLKTTAEVYAEALPVGQLLKWGDGHADAGIRDQAERARAALAALRQRHAADRELSAITDEAAELEKRLAELRSREAELAPAKKKARKPVEYPAAEVRAWAVENNVPCPPVGRVPKAVVEAWRAETAAASA